MKILIISQHIFPMQTPRAHRTTELMKEFARQGHDVTVYAVLGKYDYRSFEEETGIKVRNIPIRWMWKPFSSDNDPERSWFDRLMGRLFGKLFEFPLIEFYFRIPEVLKKEHNRDLVISIGAPHHIHWGVAKFRSKEKDNRSWKWIADCGDPFMHNGKTNLRYAYFSRFEHFFCKEVDFITVPVESAKEGYFEEYRNKIRVVPQGFKFNEIKTENIPTSEVKTFVFAGTFYDSIRNPDRLLRYLADVEIPFKFIVYTSHKELISKYQLMLGQKLQIRDSIPRDELLIELSKADFLINLENSDSPAQIPSKLIDYALVGRPILSINPEQPETTLIDQFLAGDYSSSYQVLNIEQYKIENVASKFIDLGLSC